MPSATLDKKLIGTRSQRICKLKFNASQKPVHSWSKQYSNNNIDNNEKLAYPLRFAKKKTVYLSKRSYYKIMYSRSYIKKDSL